MKNVYEVTLDIFPEHGKQIKETFLVPGTSKMNALGNARKEAKRKYGDNNLYTSLWKIVYTEEGSK